MGTDGNGILGCWWQYVLSEYCVGGGADLVAAVELVRMLFFGSA